MRDTSDLDPATKSTIRDSKAYYKTRLVQERINEVGEDVKELGIHIRHQNRRS
jgi:hypothetical protein